ncbi:hypothetical protein EJO69_10910 [Flaviflexus salsibiostraticola]|uniref:Uncharacterized protein n=1 Tax=Flaviflexus salsibiostraticola TaxID=1282737 RepID=A0A3Q8WUP7_9ACTO|nr:YhfZ family protein [Flaviflexus salsibiostraticola]AZN30752.1 hypothetical protein EJO69_10910 [Flaviflexus salsibiostraticola]
MVGREVGGGDRLVGDVEQILDPYVLAGYVDAGVWRMTKSPVPVSLAGLRATELQRPEAVDVLRDFSRAVIVARSDRPELRAVLNSLTLTALVGNQDRADAEDAALEQRILATADTLH